MQELSLELKGLHCANCAAKIEEEVKHLDGINSADLMFASQKLHLKLDESASAEEIQSRVNTIVKSHEPDVEVLNTDADRNTITTLGGLSQFKKEVTILVTGILLFVAGLTIGKGTSFELFIFLPCVSCLWSRGTSSGWKEYTERTYIR